jgi:hypothetical protein
LRSKTRAERFYIIGERVLDSASRRAALPLRRIATLVGMKVRIRRK